jgi:hypothetical protein
MLKLQWSDSGCETTMGLNFDIGPYDLCPCGSGKKYKFCCSAAARDKRHGRFPVGTVADYGPDDVTITKIAAGVIVDEFADPIVERFFGAGVATDAKVAEQIKQFFARHGVQKVVVSDGVMGCPHEEGIDFPRGGACAKCPFWAGKQGSGAGEEAAIQKKDEGATWIDGAGTFGEAQEQLLAHLQAHLELPCEVTGSEGFQWEERYVIGGFDEREYARLKKTQPSYTDKYALFKLERGMVSRWMMFGSDDIGAHVRRLSDGKVFVLGLCELEATDRDSANAQLLTNYSIWVVNNR